MDAEKLSASGSGSGSDTEEEEVMFGAQPRRGSSEMERTMRDERCDTPWGRPQEKESLTEETPMVRNLPSDAMGGITSPHERDLESLPDITPHQKQLAKQMVDDIFEGKPTPRRETRFDETYSRPKEAVKPPHRSTPNPSDSWRQWRSPAPDADSEEEVDRRTGARPKMGTRSSMPMGEHRGGRPEADYSFDEGGPPVLSEDPTFVINGRPYYAVRNSRQQLAIPKETSELTGSSVVKGTMTPVPSPQRAQELAEQAARTRPVISPRGRSHPSPGYEADLDDTLGRPRSEPPPRVSPLDARGQPPGDLTPAEMEVLEERWYSGQPVGDFIEEEAIHREADYIEEQGWHTPRPRRVDVPYPPPHDGRVRPRGGSHNVSRGSHAPPRPGAGHGGRDDGFDRPPPLPPRVRRPAQQHSAANNQHRGRQRSRGGGETRRAHVDRPRQGYPDYRPGGLGDEGIYDDSPRPRFGGVYHESQDFGRSPSYQSPQTRRPRVLWEDEEDEGMYSAEELDVEDHAPRRWGSGLFDRARRTPRRPLPRELRYREPRVASGRPARQKDPPKFSGDHCIRDYLNLFNMISRLNQWNYEECGLQLATSLIGEAAEVPSSMPYTLRADFDCLCEALHNRFLPEGS